MTNDRDTLPSIRIRAVFGRCMALLVLCLLPYAAAQSQPIQCVSAVQQLQWYAHQVQAVYNQNGMSIRYGCMQQCGGNMLCQQQCEATYAAPLNQWYAMQVQQVNYWANHIAFSCLDDPSEIEIDDDGNLGKRKLEDLKRKVKKGRRVDIDIPDDVDF